MTFSFPQTSRQSTHVLPPMGQCLNSSCKGGPGKLNQKQLVMLEADELRRDEGEEKKLSVLSAAQVEVSKNVGIKAMFGKTTHKQLVELAVPQSHEENKCQK